MHSNAHGGRFFFFSYRAAGMGNLVNSEGRWVFFFSRKPESHRQLVFVVQYYY